MTELACHQLQNGSWAMGGVQPSFVTGTGSIQFWKDGREVFDYCSWRGLFAVSLPGEVRFMDVDDAWNMGKAAGFGGPWDGTPVRAGEASDAYLLNGFDRKTLELVADGKTTVAMEVDATGWGVWVKYADYDLAPGVRRVEKLPRALSGYWVRFVSSSACVASAALSYE